LKKKIGKSKKTCFLFLKLFKKIGHIEIRVLTRIESSNYCKIEINKYNMTNFFYSIVFLEDRAPTTACHLLYYLFIKYFYLEYLEYLENAKILYDYDYNWNI